MEFMQQLILTIAPIVVTSIAGYLVGRMTKKDEAKDKMLEKKEEQDKQDKIILNAMKEGLASLLRDSLINTHDKYCARGSIPSYAFENYCRAYNAYHAMGYNGLLAEMDEEIRALPLEVKK